MVEEVVVIVVTKAVAMAVAMAVERAVGHAERCGKQSYSSYFHEVFLFFSLLISFHISRNEFLKFRLRSSEFVNTLAAIIWQQTARF